VLMSAGRLASAALCQSVESSHPTTVSSVSPRPAVVADGVSKTFRIPREHVHTLKERALHPLRRPGHDELRALRDVSFAVERGEFFGIVGRNGSGKSTLLKCLAGIYGTDRGDIYVNGRMSTFIELGVGFNMDLAAYDNVMLNATMLGLSQRETRARYDRILDFAELREFADLKLKNYSSGMLVRLAFSVMIQVDADILLIDEVLAVGDAAFQQKCYDEFARIRRSGATVLFVTHDMAAVQRFCDRAMLLEHGRCVDLGEPERVGDRYLQLNFSSDARAAEARDAGADDGAPAELAEADEAVEPEEVRLGDGKAEIVEAWFEDENGNRTEVLRTRQQCSFHARVRVHDRLENPLVGVNVHNSAGDHVWSANNELADAAGTFEPGEELTFVVRFPNLLAPDRYWATPAVARASGVVEWHDRRTRFAGVMVTAMHPVPGLVDLPYAVAVERGEPAGQPTPGAAQ
jgi:ABC-type polysaccharide/polyol phosphate transport system ATPase subunit